MPELLAHAPPDGQCDKAFDSIVAEARKHGISVAASDEVAQMALDNRGAESWERLMKNAENHCLIAQAYGGTATLAKPGAQREGHVRDKVLYACNRIETKALCNQAYREAVREARDLGLLQFSDRDVAEVVGGHGEEWDALFEKAKKAKAVVRYVRRSEGQKDGEEPDYSREWLVYLFATTSAQRSGKAAKHQFTPPSRSLVPPWKQEEEQEDEAAEALSPC